MFLPPRLTNREKKALSYFLSALKKLGFPADTEEVYRTSERYIVVPVDMPDDRTTSIRLSEKMAKVSTDVLEKTGCYIILTQRIPTRSGL